MIKNKRYIAPSIVVFTEGASEKKYLDDYFQMKRISNVKTRPCTGGSIEAMIKKVNLGANDVDEVFLIYDKDCFRDGAGQKKLNASKQKVEDRNVVFIENNPCFEYWLLLHFVSTNRYFQSCDECAKQLERSIPGYSKGEDFDYKVNVLTKVDEARKNAKIHNSRQLAQGEDPSYSQMYLLLDHLDKLVRL